MNILNHLWNIAITIVIFFITFTLFNQMITVDDVKLSTLLSGVSTLIIRFFISKFFNDIEVNFNFLRELLTIIGFGIINIII